MSKGDNLGNNNTSETINSKKTPQTLEERTWEKISEHLKKMVPADAYKRWFSESTLVSFSEVECLLAVPSDIHELWIETNFAKEFKAAISAVLGMDCHPKIKCVESLTKEESASESDGENENGKKKQSKGANSDELFEIEAEDEPDEDQATLEKKIKQIGLKQLYNFQRFVVGDNNQFAHAASQAVAGGTGSTYNPLFIHGGSGLGKTHLMHSIGQEIIRLNPRKKIALLTAEAFTNEFITALQQGKIDRFRNRYRKVDMLLIDDVHFLAGKEKSQEEFFHTFNTLLDSGTQVVLTSDRPACEIKLLAPRLMTRFESGLAVPLEPPHLETRKAILQKKLEDWNTEIAPEIIDMLAERITSSVRRLEGALVRVATYGSLGGGSLTMPQVEDLLADILREEASKTPSIDQIQKTVSEHFDMRLADMTSRRRPAKIAYARQIAMFLSRELTRSSLKEVGEAFGGRDHGTIIHACRKITGDMETDHQTKQSVSYLKNQLTS